MKNLRLFRFISAVFSVCLPLLLGSCGKSVMGMQTEYVFGTVCTVDLYEDGTEELYAEIFERLRDIEKEFSVRIRESEISRINASMGRKVYVSREVFDLLQNSVYISKVTDGAFNPALGALIELWGIGTDHERVPEIEEIEEAKKHCDPGKVVLAEEDGKYSVVLEDEKIRIDLGGIVKGFAADETVRILEKKGVKKALINFGGNVYAYGHKSDLPGSYWKIGIKNPLEDTSEPIEVVSVDSQSVVTSGGYERFFIRDSVRYHHIIDGKTGFPAENDIASVTVISKSSTLCDALATAWFVSGGKGDFEGITENNKIQLVIITKNGEIHKKE